MSRHIPYAVALGCALIAGCAQHDAASHIALVQDPDPAPGVHQLRAATDGRNRSDIEVAILARAAQICGPDRDMGSNELVRVDPGTGDLVGRFHCKRAFPDDAVPVAQGGTFPLDRFPLAPGLQRITAWGSSSATFRPKNVYRALVGDAVVGSMRRCNGPISVARTLVGIEQGRPVDRFSGPGIHVVVDYRCDNDGSATASL